MIAALPTNEWLRAYVANCQMVAQQEIDALMAETRRSGEIDNGRKAALICAWQRLSQDADRVAGMLEATDAR